MAEAKGDLSNARILVTNDDGIHAPGLKACVRIARQLSKDVWVVAPESEQSATSHSLTVRRPLRLRKIGHRRYTVDGTPTDCVVIALRKLLAERPADLVLSGVNHGANMGEDVTYSGTVAAAMEGALLGVPSIALSQNRVSGKVVSWATAERHGPPIVAKLLSLPWPREVLMNVNFPPVGPDQVQGIRVVRQGRRDTDVQVIERQDPAGRAYLWIGDFVDDETSERGTDLAAIKERAIAVTPLHLDLTHKGTLKKLAGLFS
ncbi:MAG: 5'/3'-nucleotidase SurE [Pseudomonadota bacterium]